MQISEISVPPQSPSNLGVALECRLTLQLFFCKPGLHPCYHIRTKSGGHTCKSLHLGGRGGGSEAQGLSQLHGGQALLHETWPQSNKQTTTSNNSQTPPKSAEAIGLKSLCIDVSAVASSPAGWWYIVWIGMTNPSPFSGSLKFCSLSGLRKLSPFGT